MASRLCVRPSVALRCCGHTVRVSSKTIIHTQLGYVRIMPNTHRRRRRDETVLSGRRRRCEHNSQLVHDDCRRIRSTIWKLIKQTPKRLIAPILIDMGNCFNNDDVIMSSLLKKVINI